MSKHKKPDLKKEDYRHLHSTEFQQLRYYGHIKETPVPEQPEDRCPECRKHEFIFRKKMKQEQAYLGWCKNCGFKIDTVQEKRRAKQEARENKRDYMIQIFQEDKERWKKIVEKYGEKND